MNKYILAFFLVCNVLFFGYNYYQHSNSNIGGGEVPQNINNGEKQNLNIDAQILGNDIASISMEDKIHDMEKIDNKELFTVMYNGFNELKEYKEYKEYIKIYPGLIPALYAVRLENKENYLKFYDFIFEKIKEEGLYMEDIKGLVGPVKTSEELKIGFSKILEGHYNDVIMNDSPFDKSFGDGPLHIAMTNDNVETAMKNCDNSSISGVDEETKRECYNYVYQYRATKENNLCDKIEGEYQRQICVGYLDYSQ